MIADTAVLSTSPWHHDQVFKYTDLHDLPGLEVDVMTSESDEPLDISFERHGRRHSSAGHSMRLVDEVIEGTSCGTSVASSDCSEEGLVDIESCGEQTSLFSISDDLDTTLLNVLGDSSYGGSSLAGLGWSDSELEYTVGDLEVEISDTNSDILPRMPSSPSYSHSHSHSQPSRKRRSSDGLGDKTWREMGVSERLSIVEDLSNVISNHMGLREQLEVIRIINPHASVSPTDTEFVIDLEYLTDEKLRELQEFVQKHVDMPIGCTSTNYNNNNKNNNKVVSTQQKKQTKKQRRQEQKEVRQRQRKEDRQTMKEKRSGLFRQEEVVSLSRSEASGCSSDEDIDIL